MKEATESALAARLLAMGDDELLLAHRNSEWTGHAPILEEDIAISNIAQDELGHAQIWYGMRADLTGEEPDDVVFFRDPPHFRNAQLLELPRGDWAFTLLRQFLFDAYESVLLEQLLESTHQPLLDAAAKIIREERYHLRYSAAWIRRLGLGTNESHGRLQAALDRQWAYALQLFYPEEEDSALVEAGLFPDVMELLAPWEGLVRPHLGDANLTVPVVAGAPADSRTEHTDHLAHLLNEMQQVARQDPEAEW